MEAEPVAAFPMYLIAVGVIGVALLAGTFALIYWVMGRGRDEDGKE